MEIKRTEIIKQFPWLKKKNCKYIISSSYDGLICASFLNHFLNWKLVGYYDLESLWIDKSAAHNKDDIIWVDLNILPIQGRAIGGHIVAYDNKIPKGFDSSCNPNILVKLSEKDFKYKYPFSTIIFLLWLHKKYPPSTDEAKFSILNADDVWLKYQNYNANCKLWEKTFVDYDWDLLFDNVNQKSFEKKISQKYYPLFESNNFFSQSGKIKSKNYAIQSKQLWFNPDWDEDIILKLTDYFAEKLEWTPPKLPIISNRIDGNKTKIELSSIKSDGIDSFIKKNKIFSYAITSTRTMSFTIFNKMRKNPIK
tara:strand:- start:2336 stop:3262 length:927 start_codon:yes stop_codon:yes gene_type:complete